ncbi:MAG TPA: hypothetical protein VFR81_18890 [Longimicrobium sp.]|nr:hypothetical protein [Longimicrobium sp.]
MSTSIVRAASAAFLLLAASTAAFAQEPADSAARARRPTVHILPSYSSVDFTVLGFEKGATGGVAALGESRVYGLAAEVATPLRGVDVRVGLAYSRPQLRADRPDVRNETTRASVTMLTVDAVVRGPRLLDVRPYLLLGGGVRHFDFAGASFDGEGGRQFTDNHLVPVVHAGLGLAWDVGRYDLYLEGNRYFSTIGDNERFEGEDVRTRAFTVGVRIPVN